MPQDDNKPNPRKDTPKPVQTSWLNTPTPIKRLFDQFPLVTYLPNELPKRTSIQRSKNTLYIFARGENAQENGPSINPTCLKWQTYLKLMRADFVTVPSNNHASPTGSLPFLIPASSIGSHEVVAPVASDRLREWSSKTGAVPTEEPGGTRYAAYMSLLDHRIRNAWLHTLYLTSSNFGRVAQPLYVAPETSSSLVHFSLAQSLQSAALREILKSSASPVIDLQALYRESDDAFAALSELLGDDDWFFGRDAPGLLDASVFAYTHLLCDATLGWKEEEERLGKGLREGRFQNLVEHKRKIYERCFE
ncbi:MAG: hypothetical protein Q9219_000799 [cf. Caloplaca sp. 3 TL-2023]